ncbi:Lcl C-terminal domain-containing protein [Ferrimonas marina]|uniref:Lcl C-terminal domain-containing protein n=1 Tax=Ferrimonas marina TaxID=299255 RepID=A0A1M5NSI4_9GAMM|nr:DUF1566 domain-containing protein [Ferrimonas marina]SHG92526.1 Protein of unknown function [Ferrimonas marina]
MSFTAKRRAYLQQPYLLLLTLLISGCKISDSNLVDQDTADTSQVLAYPLVATGQQHCSDIDGMTIECPGVEDHNYGQDSQFGGNDFELKDNGDGTVIDALTGLTWQQVPAAEGMSYQQAQEYVESLSLGGYDDWRLPSNKELFSISDFSHGWPYLDSEVFALAQEHGGKDEQFWTEEYVGNTMEGGSEAAFGINHSTGHIKAYPAAIEGPMAKRVRAVRGEVYGVNDFVDNGDGTVTDRATGLMWAQQDSGYGMDWQMALMFTKDSALAGHNDWRLPNIKELQSIVDYRYAPSASFGEDQGPAIDRRYFTITVLPSNTTLYPEDYPYFWSSTSAYFSPEDPAYAYAWYVAFGTAVNNEGEDLHGAGVVRFDTKYEGGPAAEGGERYYNFVRLVRNTP